jgi:hypothetical protein
MNENLYGENMDDIILEAMGLELVEPDCPKDPATGLTQGLLDRLVWMRQELARRYLIGAMKYLDDWMVKSIADEDVIPALDAKALLMGCLNLNIPGFEKFLQDLADECTSAEENLPLVECRAARENDPTDPLHLLYDEYYDEGKDR